MALTVSNVHGESTKMNLTKRILDRMESGHGLIDVICELVENSDDIDYHDVADVIKGNPTMLEMLEAEFKTRNMIPRGEEEINLTEIFKGL